MMTYEQFLERKIPRQQASGFEPPQINPLLWEWQRMIVVRCLRLGRAAIFADCGLGKTPMQLEWAKQCSMHTAKPTLILAPLAVAPQTVREGKKFDIPVTHVREPESADEFDDCGIIITNYEQLEWFLPFIDEFGAIVLDESSILKNFTGKMRGLLTETFRKTKYRLCCSATPAPNDFTELGQHADFLGICSPGQMLATYFINDASDTGTWRLKGHADGDFWRWVSSWAVCLSKPSDIGFSDEGFDLPPVNTKIVKVAVDHKADADSGDLIRNATASATEIHRESRRTLEDRCRAAAEIVNASKEPFVVWCHLNDESELLNQLIPDAVQVKGSDSADNKENRLNAFSVGNVRVIVTKPSIAGMGLNWQHCHNEIYVGLNYSFEKFYQASKRIHRYGQTEPVNRYIVQTDLEDGVLKAIEAKGEQHEAMYALTKFTRDNLSGGSATPIMNTEIKLASGSSWNIYNGDCVRVARTMASGTIGFSIFSPPFADLFTYSSDVQDMGNCESLDAFMVQFGYLVDELFRLTMPGRECAVHCCDLLATKWKDGEIELKDFSGRIKDAFRKRGWLLHSVITIWKDPVVEMQRTKAHGLLQKTLLKDSAQSRVGAPDYLLIFKKPGKNPKSIPHCVQSLPLAQWQELASPVWMHIDQGNVLNGKFARDEKDERHICPLQLDIINRALLLWSAEGDTVFSPFAGIGSEGYCAVKMGRKFIGAELKESYWMAAQQFLRQAEDEKRDLFSAPTDETLFDLPCAIQSDAKTNEPSPEMESRQC